MDECIIIVYLFCCCSIGPEQSDPLLMIHKYARIKEETAEWYRTTACNWIYQYCRQELCCESRINVDDHWIFMLKINCRSRMDTPNSQTKRTITHIYQLSATMHKISEWANVILVQAENKSRKWKSIKLTFVNGHCGRLAFSAACSSHCNICFFSHCPGHTANCTSILHFINISIWKYINRIMGMSTVCFMDQHFCHFVIRRRRLTNIKLIIWNIKMYSFSMGNISVSMTTMMIPLGIFKIHNKTYLFFVSVRFVMCTLHWIV